MGKVYSFPKDEQFITYEDVRAWREHHIEDVSDRHEKLNQFHDEVIGKVISLSMKKIESEWGAPPTHFAFFMMGSAARMEQSIWSDQDHGIIFSPSELPSTQTYYLKLGEEIAKGLDIAGYDLCDGFVMASNPRWCKSLSNWKEQINDWLTEESFESIRYLLTFFDSRVFYGDEVFLLELKELIFQRVKENPQLLQRFFDNISHLKKVKGIFGQLLVETTGKHTGCIHFKQSVLFPYVNVLRVLAIKERITNPSTVQRFQALPETYSFVKKHEGHFWQLLVLRLRHQRDAATYDSVHYLNITKLSNEEKNELKCLIDYGNELFQQSKKLIEKGCRSSW